MPLCEKSKMDLSTTSRYTIYLEETNFPDASGKFKRWMGMTYTVMDRWINEVCLCVKKSKMDLSAAPWYTICIEETNFPDASGKFKT